MRWKLHVRFGKRAGETDQQNANTAPRSDFTTPTASQRSGSRSPNSSASDSCHASSVLEHNGSTSHSPAPGTDGNASPQSSAVQSTGT